VRTGQLLQNAEVIGRDTHLWATSFLLQSLLSLACNTCLLLGEKQLQVQRNGEILQFRDMDFRLAD